MFPCACLPACVRACVRLCVRVCVRSCVRVCAGDLYSAALPSRTPLPPTARPVGSVKQDRVITGKTIRAGDVVLALASSGVHSNGFSLVRKVLEVRGVG